MPTFLERLQHGWNAFFSRDKPINYKDIGTGSSSRPNRIWMRYGNERSIIASIYTRMAIDAASVNIQHVRVDDNGRYKEPMVSDLNYCLTVEANIDQTPRELLKDAYMSLFDEGCIAIVPVDTTDNIIETGSFDIQSLRIGKVVEWFPRHVRIQLYNDRTGQKEDITLPKKHVAIVPNPFYEIMNEPNSTLKRLTYKLNLLDAIDEQSGSGKLDLIIQLPYSVKTDLKRTQAEQRRKDIEDQLTGSKYGIAYVDATEHITQLNRSLDNNLMHQIEYLTTMLYSQLGISPAIMDGSADEKVMLNYNNRIIEPLVSAVVDGMNRAFLTKTARSQGQRIMSFRDPFKLVPVNNIAEIADKFTRNEIMTSNEIRQIVGMKPANDPKADQLINANLNHNKDELNIPKNNQNGSEVNEDE